MMLEFYVVLPSEMREETTSHTEISQFFYFLRFYVSILLATFFPQWQPILWSFWVCNFMCSSHDHHDQKPCMNTTSCEQWHHLFQAILTYVPVPERTHRGTQNRRLKPFCLLFFQVSIWWTQMRHCGGCVGLPAASRQHQFEQTVNRSKFSFGMCVRVCVCACVPVFEHRNGKVETTAIVCWKQSLFC